MRNLVDGVLFNSARSFGRHGSLLSNGLRSRTIQLTRSYVSFMLIFAKQRDSRTVAAEQSLIIPRLIPPKNEALSVNAAVRLKEGYLFVNKK